MDSLVYLLRQMSLFYVMSLTVNLTEECLTWSRVNS